MVGPASAQPSSSPPSSCRSPPPSVQSSDPPQPPPSPAASAPSPSSSATALSFPFPFSLEAPSSHSPDQPTPTETHGTDYIAVHLKMRLSELIHLLLHCDLLTSHLQTLAFWRRNHNNGLTLSWQTCPCARAHPNVSLARVFALCPLGMTLVTQGIWFVHTHKTYTKTSAWR